MVKIEDDGFTVSVASKSNIDQAAGYGWVQAGLADDEYGWALIFGRGVARYSGAVAANARLYTTTTAGSINDASSSQTRLPGYAPEAITAAGVAAIISSHAEQTA